MTKRIILLVAGLIIFGLGCAMLIMARDWLSAWLRDYDPQWICFGLTFMIATVTNYLTMLTILIAFRPNKNPPEDIQAGQLPNIINPAPKGTPKIYRHSHLKVAIFFIISIVLSTEAYLFNNPSRPSILPGYVVGFLFSLPFLLLATSAKNFFVKVDSKEIIINGFWVKKFLTTDISKVRFGATKGRCIIITLNNGSECSIGGTLKNHYQLVETLMTYVRKNGGRWFSDDYYISKHFKKSVG